jgi:glycosyltransferase involved in cell wall biosynthesis
MPEVSSPDRLPRTPKVSVAMITYNHAPFVEQAVRSALTQQTDFDYEVVIGDDASTDGTREILLRLQVEHPERLRLILHEQNLGFLGKHNGVAVKRACRGDYVAYLEGDDYWTHPEKLARQVACLEADPALSGCYHPVTVDWPDRPRTISSGCEPGPDLLLDIAGLLERGCPHTPSVMIRRRCLPQQFPEWYFTILMGDWPGFLLTLERGPFRYLPGEPLCVYRVHAAGYWSGRTLIKRTGEEQKALRAFRTHLDARYHPLIDRQLARRIAYLAEGHADNGDLAEGRKCYVQFLRTWPRYRAVSLRRTLGLGMRLFAPGVLSALRRAKELASRS